MAGFICAIAVVLGIIDLCLYTIMYFGAIIGTMPYNKEKRKQ